MEVTAPLDPLLIFHRFAVGPANRLAAAAARRAAESPGRSYNPLVICGPTGLGKTHLLSAIGHLAQEMDPELYVHYEPLDSFVDRLTASITAGTVDEFRAAVGGVGLLLLDDLQQAAGKVRTQEELLRLWEEMVPRGAQVVVASDRPPHEIPALDARLNAHLGGGLIVEIAPPEAETRLVLLQQMLREQAAELPSEVLDALAALPIDSVAELQGALARVLSQGEAGQRLLRAEQLTDLLGLPEASGGAAGDEFGDFLSDISSVVAAVVETAPWRRRIAHAILRWEGEGVRTRRLEEALDADSAPDVDALLDAFARDVARLREVRGEMRGPPPDPMLLLDPDRLPEAEALLIAERAAAPPMPRTTVPARDPRPERAEVSVDRWFLDREKLAWNWLALDDRLTEEMF